MIRDKQMRIDAQRKWATYLLVAVSAFVYFSCNFEIQSAANTRDMLIECGALSPTHVWRGEIWRFLTAIFLHENFLHFALNTFVLLQVGRLLEPIIGGVRLLFLYLLTGSAGFALSILLNTQVALGSSGAVFGLLGCMLGALINLPPSQVDKKVLRSLTGFVALNIALSIITNILPFEVRIDNASHLGGLFFGAIFGFVLVTETEFFSNCPDAFKKQRQRLTQGALVLGLVMFFGVIGAAVKPIFLPRYHEVMAMEALILKNTETALDHASWLEKSPSSQVASLIIQSRVAAERGERELSTRLAEKALNVWSGNLKDFYVYAMADNLLLEPKGSYVLCDLVISKGLEDSGVLNDCAWLTLTSTDPETHNVEKGAAWARTAVSGKQDVPAAVYHTLAEAYLQSGREDEALHAIERGLVKGDKDLEKELVFLKRKTEQKLALRVENGSKQGK